MDGFHQEPLYDGYSGRFASVTKCCECGRISMYEDAHPASPCWQCGARVRKFMSAKWIKPVKVWDWNIFWFKTIKEGYWSDKDGNKIV